MQQIQIQTATQDKAAYIRNAQKIIDKLKANDLELIDATLEYALHVFNSNEPPLRKLLILRLIKDAIVIKSSKFINKYIQTRPLLTFIGNICTHKLGDSNPNRGTDLFHGQDPQSSIEFLNLALELVEFLATTFPKDSKGAPTKFKIQYDELVQMGVKFPPQSSLILPFDPNKVSQEPIQQKPLNNNKERDETMLKLNQSKQTIYQDIEMINETLVNDSDMGYINEVLVTYSESMNVMEKQFENLINKAQQYDGVLNEDELAELYALKDFVQKFQKYYYAYLEKECTADAYNALKKKTLAHIQKIQNKDFDYPPPQQQKQQKQNQFQQSQFQNEDEMLRRAIEESKIVQQNSYLSSKQLEEQKKQEEIKRQQEEELRQAKIREEQIKQEQLRAEEQRRENEKKEHERKEKEKQEQIKQEQIKQEQIKQEQIKQEQLRLEEKRKEQLRLEQLKQEQNRLEAIQQQQQEMKQKEIEDYWNNQFQTPNPDNQQYVTPTKLGSQTFSQQQQQYQQQYQQQQQQSQLQYTQSYMQSSFQQQKQDYQQKNGAMNNNYIYSNFNQQQQYQKQPIQQTNANQFEQNYNNSQGPNQNYLHGENTREQLPMNHITSNFGKKKGFDENFDGLSQSTLTQQFFPLKMDQQIPIKNYIGKFIKYDNSQFELLHTFGLTESQKKRFKVATIKGKAALVNSPQLQIGIKQELQYVPLKEKNYLKLTLYIGNKTQTNFDNCKMQFEGDNKQFSMWIKPDKIIDKIEAGQQIQQEVIGIFKQYENYRLVNVLFSAEWANKQIASNFFLTTTLVSFMEFKDISLQIFRTKWRQKKPQILRGETFLLNPKIVKTGYYLRKIFPKLCEFNSYQQFQDQQLDYFSDRQLKYISYKLCGIFELTNVNQNYMIKFIVLPNMQCTIQIIGNNEHLCKQMLNTLNWILGLE